MSADARARWRRIDGIVEAALELAPSERPTFVRRACGDDTDLHREVESLLAHDRSDDFLEVPAAAEAARLTVGAEPPSLTGERIGHFEVLERIGRGGMGEVYMAHDARLQRRVAIKRLPAHLCADLDRVRRFRQEALAASALNHPNILTVYEIVQHEGADLLVTELVDGLTLRERAQVGALPLAEVLDLGLQVAQGLAAAHAIGIVHRDVKPENVMVRRDGLVKLLDFGIAKATQGVLGSEWTGTGPGSVLGTVGYMSPEHARGQQVDARSDVWSLGVILYELATGQTPFPGATPADRLAAILERDPLPPSELREGLPDMFDRLLMRTLAKDPADRPADAGELAAALAGVADAPTEGPEALASPSAGKTVGPFPPPRWPARTTAALLVLTLLGGAAYVFWARRTPANRHGPIRFNIDVAPRTGLPRGVNEGTFVAISRDGAQLVYQVVGTGLHVRPLDRTVSRLLPGTAQAENPFFSPDGRWVGYAANGKLQRTELSGGPSRVIADLGGAGSGGASWGEDGTIVYSPAGVAGLLRVSAEGGAPQKLTEPDARKEASHRWPQVLPGGDAVLFTVLSPSLHGDESRIEVLSLETGVRKILVQGATHGHYVPTGHLVFASGGSLFATPFDLRRLKTTGRAVPVIEDLRMSDGGTGAAQFAFSDTGIAVYLSPRWRGGEWALLWVNRRGEATPVSSMRRGFRHPRLSPDGRRLAVAIQEEEPGSCNVWLLDIGRQAWSRLTFDRDSWRPVWSPDGKRLAFSSSREGYSNIFWIPADGGTLERLTTSTSEHYPSAWSRDGAHLFFTESDPDFDIWELTLDSQLQSRPVLRAPFEQWNPVPSPDGRWLAYESDESGRNEVYVRPYGGLDTRWVVSTDGGCCPLWNPTGREIFYRNGSKVLVVKVTTTPEFEASGPTALFDRGRDVFGYDVTPDGQRLVMAEYAESEPERVQIVVVPDWFEELRAKVEPP